MTDTLMRFQNPREAISRSRILLISLVYVFIYLCICVTPPVQTKKDTDLKFGIHTPGTLSKNKFLFFRKNDPEGR